MDRNLFVDFPELEPLLDKGDKVLGLLKANGLKRIEGKAGLICNLLQLATEQMAVACRYAHDTGQKDNPEFIECYQQGLETIGNLVDTLEKEAPIAILFQRCKQVASQN